MGRSGGGGGGFSGGGFGSGHSTGGFSGGGRSSGGGFSGGGGSGSSGPGHGHGGFYGGFRPGGYYGGGGGGFHSRPGGCLTQLVVFVIVLVIIGFVLLPDGGSTTDIPQNTVQRTALAGQVDKSGWYEDGVSWIQDERTLVSGLETFYKQTGVQPYVLFVPYDAQYWSDSNINAKAADAYLESYYKAHFTDEAHFMFAYFETQNDTRSEMDGAFRYLSGYAADTIMDSEALKIFWGYFNQNYYDTSITLESMLANTFASTAERIMSAPTNGWDFAKTGVVVVMVIGVAVCMVIIVKVRAKRKKEHEAYTESVLNTPLDKFGTDEADELSKKYEDNDKQ